MAFSEVCRICLCVNVSMLVLKKTSLRNLYKTLTNSFMDEDEEPIIVCFTCHARLIRCRTLQQQAIESKAVLEQLLAGGSMSIPKWHEARDKIQFTPISHIDIRPVECDIEHDCKNEMFSLESVKVEEENFENEYYNFEQNENHETENSEKQEDLEIDAFEDRHTDSEYDLPLIAFGSKIKKDDDDIETSEKKIKSNSTDCNINDVRKENLDFEGPTIKSNPKVKIDNQPINRKGKHPAKIMKTKILKQKSVNILKKKTSGTSTKYIFECDGCSKKFSTKDILAKHISYSHKTQKNSDTTAFRTQVELTPVPQQTEIFNCDICEFKTSQKRNILAHLKAHVAKQMYCCNNCEYKCIRKSVLQMHMKIHTGEKPFSCNICEYRCITKCRLQKHMKIHTGEKSFSCNVCEYRCITKCNLQRHLKTHTGAKPFSCNICEYRGIRKSHLQRHMKIHTGEKLFSCNICEYRCITKSRLQKHMKIHTGEKPFSCNICEYRCIRKCDLQTHIKIHTGEKSFSCNSCGYRCIRKSDLQTHIKIHTGEKPFSCNICEYRCIRKSTLLTHMKIHTGEKPFSCNICEYRCISKSDLQKHMKIHTGEKPFSCKICEYRCIRKKDLQRHLTTHIGAKPVS
ncbi:unnamed protein product [Parnassius mnemosyne]|uniref:C2H2-type domain-containing protein n=1 Tax=Parnassius mnemosyne TaxID=213953 RepID=A0AAV1LBG4_9NEOP